ncbi:MAG: ABC transporter ATP-binding protein [Candidatus Krumholzibacteriia bacterium]
MKNPSEVQAASETTLGLKALRPYLSLLRGQARDLALALLLMAAATAVTLAIPLLAGRFVDRLRTAGEGGGFPTPLLLGLAGLLAMQLVGTFFYSLVSQRLGLRTITRLRQRLFAHMVELPSLFFVRQKPGDLSSRVTSDVGSIQYMLTSGAVGFVRALATLVGAVVLMLTMNVQLSLVVLLMVPATILLVQLFGRRLQRLSRDMYRELGQVSNHVQQVAGAIRLVKVFNNQAGEQGRFGTMLDRYYEAGMKRAWLTAALEAAIQVLLWITLIAVVIYGFYLSSVGTTTYGELVTFLLLAFRVAAPLGSLSSLYASAQGAVAAAGRLDEIFATPREDEDRRRPTAPERVVARAREVVASAPSPPAAGRTAAGTAAAAAAGIARSGGAAARADRPRGALVEAEQVSFAYDEGAEPVLHDIDFRIESGQKVGLVGPSGAGKTSLAGLLLRLFDPQQGEFRLDGVPFREHELPDLRAQMAYVSQEPILYDDSIDANIRFGLEDASEESVREAARRAHALEFIDRLPDGLATTVGDRGVRLSGGQRQRIALARAFLRDPRFLLLDEPTSALDAAAEETVQRALRDLMDGRTALVVAHRLSLVRDLDLILVLENGRLVEQGPHAELLAAGGLYAHLFRLQHGRLSIRTG